MTIRPETPADLHAIHEVNRLAFGQDAEADLVDGLRAGGFVRLSLVAEVEGQIVGHILFGTVTIHTETGVVEAVALALMAVSLHISDKGSARSSWRKGCGSAGKQDTESSWCWGTRPSIHGLGSRLRWQCH